MGAHPYVATDVSKQILWTGQRSPIRDGIFLLNDHIRIRCPPPMDDRRALCSSGQVDDNLNETATSPMRRLQLQRENDKFNEKRQVPVNHSLETLHNKLPEK